jgi:hypothetical protein
VKNENTAESCQFLKLLVNDEVRSLTLNGLPIFYSQKMKCVINTISCVANDCPNLQKLVCEEDNDIFLDHQLVFFDMVRMLSCTLRFVGLQQLDIVKMVCTDLSLALLAENLPQLRYKMAFN